MSFRIAKKAYRNTKKGFQAGSKILQKVATLSQATTICININAHWKNCAESAKIFNLGHWIFWSKWNHGKPRIIAVSSNMSFLVEYFKKGSDFQPRLPQGLEFLLAKFRSFWYCTLKMLQNKFADEIAFPSQFVWLGKTCFLTRSFAINLCVQQILVRMSKNLYNCKIYSSQGCIPLNSVFSVRYSLYKVFWQGSKDSDGASWTGAWTGCSTDSVAVSWTGLTAFWADVWLGRAKGYWSVIWNLLF